MNRSLQLTAGTYNRARCAGYLLESRLLYWLARHVPGGSNRLGQLDLKTILTIQKELSRLLERDTRNIGQGIYPLRVLQPESLFKHALRLPRIFWDGLGIAERRRKGRTAEFKGSAKTLVKDQESELPRYYRRNFHFQTDGYLSDRSAELYEHQVELLFGGGADAMRRLIIPPLKRHFAKNPTGKGLKFLEIGAGTGRATKFVELAFPQAKIVAVDLSEPYLKAAQRKLSPLQRIDFLQTDGAHLPFQNDLFDAVYSVFLFHELPEDERNDVLRESLRVLKPGGFVGLVDSLQEGDFPEFDPILAEFPQDFHEPFFRNYLEVPMERLMSHLGVEEPEREIGFFSKACWGAKPLLRPRSGKAKEKNHGKTGRIRKVGVRS